MKLCRRCGIEQPFTNFRKRSDKDGLRSECKTCATQRETIRRFERRNGLERPKPVKVTCSPWQGEFDEEDNPVKNGKLFMAGERSCGKRDCVNRAHVLAVVNV